MNKESKVIEINPSQIKLDENGCQLCQSGLQHNAPMRLVTFGHVSAWAKICRDCEREASFYPYAAMEIVNLILKQQVEDYDRTVDESSSNLPF